MPRKTLSPAERGRRASVVDRAKALKHSRVGTRVKLDGRIFFVRMTKGGKLTIIERYLDNVGLYLERWEERLIWSEQQPVQPQSERIMEAAIGQKSADKHHPIF